MFITAHRITSDSISSRFFRLGFQYSGLTSTIPKVSLSNVFQLQRQQHPQLLDGVVRSGSGVDGSGGSGVIVNGGVANACLDPLEVSGVVSPNENGGDGSGVLAASSSSAPHYG